MSDKRLHRGPALPSQICRQQRRERERQRERGGGRWGPGQRRTLPRRQKIIDGRTAGHYRLHADIDVTPSLSHALTVSMVGALHQTIDIIQQENTRNYLIQFDRNCKPGSLQRLSVID